MPAASQTASSTFAYRRAKPFSNAQFRFRSALADYAARLLPKLQARTTGDPGANQYTGITVRIADHAVYLEAIVTNTTEWGGFGFDFARLLPVSGGLYNLSVRRSQDWARAEHSTIASASVYFTGTVISPRATDWVRIARKKSFEGCIELLIEEPTF